MIIFTFFVRLNKNEKIFINSNFTTFHFFIAFLLFIKFLKLSPYFMLFQPLKISEIYSNHSIIWLILLIIGISLFAISKLVEL